MRSRRWRPHFGDELLRGDDPRASLPGDALDFAIRGDDQPACGVANLPQALPDDVIGMAACRSEDHFHLGRAQGPGASTQHTRIKDDNRPPSVMSAVPLQSAHQFHFVIRIRQAEPRNFADQVVAINQKRHKSLSEKLP